MHALAFLSMISKKKSEKISILRTVDFVTDSAGGVAVPIYIVGEATILAVSIDGASNSVVPSSQVDSKMPIKSGSE